MPFSLRFSLLWIALLALPGLAACARTPADPTLTVSAASDLTLAFEELGAMYEAETGTPVVFNFGSTGKLAQQIEQGAPVDLFAAANTAYVDRLAAAGRLLPGSVQRYARGRLALWTRTGAPFHPQTLADLLDPAVQRVAIANPEHAPYGMAARQALQSAGVWEAIQPKLVLGENVRQTLQFAETGDVDVALVALSLSIPSDGTWTLVPEDLHDPIDQSLAIVAGSPRTEAARRFIALLRSPRGQAVLQRYGFTLPPTE
ncbi:MAG: molybdate ABC transporter substrate-binding protein [Caldilineae bacterium]|nr:MAG: molybdate ABC transporter substrate-binding protein [Caldilineae bacterium]